MVEATYRVKEARKQFYTEHGRHPDDEEIAELAGLSMRRLSAVLLTPKAPRSLEQKIGINQNLKPSVRPFLNSTAEFFLQFHHHVKHFFQITNQRLYIFSLLGSACRSRSRNIRGNANKAVHETRYRKGIGKSQPEGEPSYPMEVWNGRWENEDIARDWGADGSEQRENKANRIVCVSETEEQEEDQIFAAVCGFIATALGPLYSHHHIFDSFFSPHILM